MCVAIKSLYSGIRVLQERPELAGLGRRPGWASRSAGLASGQVGVRQRGCRGRRRIGNWIVIKMGGSVGGSMVVVK